MLKLIQELQTLSSDLEVQRSIALSESADKYLGQVFAKLNNRQRTIKQQDIDPADLAKTLAGFRVIGKSDLRSGFKDISNPKNLLRLLNDIAEVGQEKTFGEDENHRRIGFRKYMNAPTNEVCLEACREKITDEDLFSLLLRLSGSKSAAELKRMSKNKRDEVLREVKAKNSTSTWQIAKVSGFSQSLIARL